jgi:DNA-binding SARP family transcriptional activator
MGPRMEFRILGPLEAWANGAQLSIPSRQQRTLLALLVINANRVLSADRIVEDVWNGRPPGSGTKALAFHVSRLRDALAPGRHGGASASVLETEAGGYVLRVDPDEIDAVRFERLEREAHACLADDPAAARSLLVEALDLWRGDALADVAYVEFAQSEIRRLEELRLAALEDRLEADLALGGHVAAIGELEALLEANPLRERLRGLLMLALYRSGRQAEALRVGGAGRRLLSEELGIDASPELAHLEARILAQDPLLELPARTAAAGRTRARNPYKGLRAFGEADGADFFGREALVARLVARVEEAAHAGRLLVVVGPSGSGKSSVVRAGLLPALRASPAPSGAPWRIATMVPGVAPFAELAAGLAASGASIDRTAIDRTAIDRPDAAPAELASLVSGAVASVGGPLLLVIDQLEELFVRVDDETRTRFLDALVALLTSPECPLVVVATLRADFLHVPLALGGLGELVREGTELVTPLTRGELERAIVRPADAVGIEVEPALVVEMVNDVAHRPGALPLLEFALTELFERSDGRRLSRDGYAAIGGVTGALGRRADEAWRSFDAGGRAIAQQVLLDLVELADAGVATARRVPRSDLESLAGDGDAARVGVVLDDLGRSGLLTFDVDQVSGAPTVEIAHEALLAHWPRLSDWIEDLRDDLRTRRRLSDAADEWEVAGRSPGYLSSGARLEWFEAWALATRLSLTDGERAYLAASVAERDRLAREGAERAEREGRLERRARVIRRSLIGVVAAGVVIGSLLLAALVGEWRTAGEQAELATARRLAAASVASLESDPQLSVLLALQAADSTVGRGYVADDAYDALQWALQAVHVEFPAGTLSVGVRSAPDGPRGVFLVGPEVLMRLGSDYAGRGMTPEECRSFLRSDSCAPVAPPTAGVSLGVRTAAGTVPAERLAAAALNGTTVRALSELPADVSPLVEDSKRVAGVSIEWDPALGGDLKARLTGGVLPDVAIVSRPSLVSTAARDGYLLDIAGLADTSAIGADVGDYALTLGSVTTGSPGPVGRYGVPIAATVDDLLWYPREALSTEGHAPPRTAAELDALVAALHEDGQVPWCFGTAPGGRSAFAAAAWVEDLFLDAQGLATYDRWIAGDLPFESASFRAAVEAFGADVMGPGEVLEGLKSAAYISERVAPLPMVAFDEPECWFYRGGSTDLATFPAGLASRAGAVPIPATSPGRKPVLGRLFFVVVLHDRPEVRRVVESLLGTPFASALSSRLGDAGLFPVRDVGVEGAAVLAADATRLRDALGTGGFRVRAVDVLPDQVAAALVNDLGSYLFFGDRSTEDLGFSADLVWDELRAAEAP